MTMILQFTFLLKTCGNLTTYATLKMRSILNRKAEPARRRLGRRRVWSHLCVIALTLCFTKDLSVASNYTTNHYRQYAFIVLNDVDEFMCIDELYFRESRWQPSARNGSHYGIPQGRSTYLKNASGTKQIEWGIKYNLVRYGSMCKALAHYKAKGWH